ncbi:MAG: O-antigen ligase family protein [Ilumatobacteraceae bacterium]|nr:O-antigen ligase family protein [Ilumatobacteraceae bacterium]
MEPSARLRSVHSVHRATAAWVLIVGVVVAVDPAGLWPFGPMRWLVVSTGGLAIIAICLWRPERGLDRRTLRLWLVLLTCLALGSVVNGDVWMALVGTDTRHFGLFTWLLCFGLFCAGQQLRGHHTALVKACAVAALATGLWCVWELTFGPPIALAATTDRLSGPFGSAALLGAAICLLLPPTVALAADRNEQLGWRAPALIAALLCTIALVGSGARAAWVGLVVAGGVVAWKVPRTRRPLAAALGVVLVGIVVALPQVESVLERSAGTTSRVDEWRIAANVVAEHPLLGVGPEGYRIAFSEGVDDGYERTYPRDRVLPDRAHSSLLDLSLAGGVIAGLAFAALTLLVARRAIQQMPVTSPAGIGLATAVLAHFSAQLLLFPVFELDPIAWLLAGAVVGMRSTQPVSPQAPRATRPLAVLAAAVGLLALTAGIFDVAANRLARDSLTASAHGDSAAAAALASRATRLRPDAIAYRMTAVQVLLQADTVAATDAALRDARGARDWSSNDPIATDLWASSLLQRALQTGDETDTRNALAAWTTLVERDPHRGRWQLQLGRAAATAGETELAREAWERAAALGQAQAAQLLERLP